MKAYDEQRAILGVAITQPAALDGLEIDASDFLDKDLGRTFAFLRDATEAGKPVSNPRWLASELKAASLLDALGGLSGLGAVVAEGIPEHAAFYASEIRTAAQLQRLAGLGRQLSVALENDQASPETLIARIEAESQMIRSSERASTVTYQDAARRALERVRAQQSEERAPSVRTGLGGLDDCIGGLHAGELVILAARPSIGKSALAFQIAEHAAKRNGVLFVSLEMQAEDLANRAIAGAIGAEIRELRAGAVYSAQIRDAEAFVDSLDDSHLEIFYSRNCTTAKVRGLARLMQSKPAGLRLIVVDYLGLMQSTDRRKPRWEQISEISGDLKSLALELGVPVLACCQLGRDAEGKPPHLAQLRDSGAIEQDADVVMLLHREGRDSTEATLNVAKNRNGACGAVSLGFDPASARFFELATQEYDF